MNETHLSILRSIFPQLTYAEVVELYNSATLRRLPKRTILCRQGEVAKSFFVLLEGEVIIASEIDGKWYEIDRLRGGCFGEIALLLGVTRAAFVGTTVETTVLEISREKFEEYAQTNPAFILHIARMVLGHMVEQDKKQLIRLKAHDEIQRTTELANVLQRQLQEYINQPFTVQPIWGKPGISPQYETDIFMIMPFSEQLTQIYNYQIKPVAAKLNLTIKRADDFFTRHSVIDEIWGVTNAAKLVIADCTGKNPNVFYELGIAHTVGKPCILITQSIDDIPFDIRSRRHIEYTTSLPGLEKFQADLEIAIRKILNLGRA
jgi:CRP-like cAMP-binding protein